MARARRELLLRAHRYRLRREDLEDCYSQATLELVAHARKGRAFSSRLHVGNALEQRFLSRVHDRRRALGGRSPMQAALEAAMPLGRAGEGRSKSSTSAPSSRSSSCCAKDLRRMEQVARDLTPDQRLVLAWQVGLQLSGGEFCRRFGWSPEKYRKVAQRARAQLRRLMAVDETSVPPGAGVSERETGTHL